MSETTTTDTLERIATALERIADALEGPDGMGLEVSAHGQVAVVGSDDKHEPPVHVGGHMSVDTSQ